MTATTAKEQSKALNRAFFLTLGTTPDGQKVLEYLERTYGRGGVRKGKESGEVDTVGTVAAAAQLDVLYDIRRRISDGQLAR